MRGRRGAWRGKSAGDLHAAEPHEVTSRTGRWTDLFGRALPLALIVVLPLAAGAAAAGPADRPAQRPQLEGTGRAAFLVTNGRLLNPGPLQLITFSGD